jgi:hypothetical protein
MASIPRSRLYYFIEQGMHFRVTVTLRASRVERWIYRVQREFLDRAPENSMSVGLDYGYTDRECAAILQLSVASETLVFQICHAVQ